MSRNVDPIRWKLDRLRGGEVPRCWDVFGGCGGLSLGFHTAGFKIAGSVELDAAAAATHAHNFHRDDPRHAVHAQPRDITTREPAELLAALGIPGDPSCAVDVLLGGPPCQAYARVGQAKLREVAKHPTAFLQDSRGRLFERYLHSVEALRPLVVVMENVPDVLNYGGQNIAESVCERLNELGYDCAYTLLNAAFYGVPQLRERLFLCGWSRQLGAIFEFPKPTHRAELPIGYLNSRSVALRTLREATGGLFRDGARYHYVAPPPVSPQLPAAVSAREALGDLPAITAHLAGELTRGMRRLDELVPYPAADALPPYARLMRRWPGFAATSAVREHVIR
ncbi:DNA (cytosine-5-)-methyltransferase [Gemmata sp. JC673]|uniref:DNA (cytosine-5-)-methyltransferase n=1 Tax=Gemmata algarum TaxID=2975278 RepID=A0ABU5F7C4_9BACT|nr:DNA (cytosine-5-)-methyltransferase [Gemmata algarum]MDY3562677.1 DNA (cytosine-5-)-methyltransferase [Gemmata algarum]